MADEFTQQQREVMDDLLDLVKSADEAPVSRADMLSVIADAIEAFGTDDDRRTLSGLLGIKEEK